MNQFWLIGSGKMPLFHIWGDPTTILCISCTCRLAIQMSSPSISSELLEALWRPKKLQERLVSYFYIVMLRSNGKVVHMQWVYKLRQRKIDHWISTRLPFARAYVQQPEMLLQLVGGRQLQTCTLLHLYYLYTTFSLFLDSSLSRICNSLNAFSL